jgi:hypothetical protein
MMNRFLSSSLTSRVFAFAAATGLLSSLIGCGMSGGGAGAVAPAITAAATPAWGQVHGGQQPVTGATITIYTAGVNTPGSATGYGAGATALASTTTDSLGNFSIPAGTYTCPTPAKQAYIVASGGNPQVGGGVNSNIVLMAALGTCPAGGNLTTTVPFVDINEVTTVAAVWALQQFMAPPAAGNVGVPQIGAPNTVYSNGLSGANAMSVQTAVQGMNNAFITASILADVATGASPNTNYNAYATPETTKMNTLADILAYCVNSDPANSAHCQLLNNDATPTGATTAADTVQAAWYMAQNPTHNLSALWAFISSTAPFQPYLGVPGGVSAAFFNDTTIAINYAPIGPNTVRGVANANDFALARSNDVAIDMYGNAWFANWAQLSNYSTTGADGFDCLGAVACASQGVSEIGIDGSPLANQINSYTPSTTGGAIPLLTTSPAGGARTYAGGSGTAFPGQVAIDLTNRAWVANNADSAASAYNAKVGTTTVLVGSVGVFPGSTGAGVNGVGGNATLTNSTGYVTGAQPYGLAIDGSNNVFISFNQAVASNVFEGQSFAKMSAADGSGYTVTSGANSQLPATGAAYLDLDTNPSVTGGIVWASNSLACTVTGQLYSGTQGTTTGNVTSYGLISQYSGATAAPLADNEQATTISNATVGAGTSVPVSATPYGNTGNCGATTDYVGQVQSAYMANPFGLAVDRNNGVWVSDQYNASLKTGFDGLTYYAAPTASSGSIPNSYYVVNGVLPSSPTASTPTVGKSGTTLTQPGRLAVDGNNNVWVPNQTNNSIAEASFNSATGQITFLTPGAGTNTGFGTNPAGTYGIGFIHPISVGSGVAVDPSGNVWITNESNNGGTYKASNGATIPLGYSTTVIVGAAGPVITPKALAVKYNKIGQKP